MKISEILHEKKTKEGTYAGVKFDENTVDSIYDYIKENKIPNPVHRDKLHTTLLYSRKYLPNYKPLGELDKPLLGKPGELIVWETNKDSSKKARCLVLKYKCPALVKRHEFLMKEHEATYDYDDYTPHVTLSYDIGDMEIKDLSPIKDIIKEIKINKEYGEKLDLDWAVNNSAK